MLNEEHNCEDAWQEKGWIENDFWVFGFSVFVKALLMKKKALFSKPEKTEWKKNENPLAFLPTAKIPIGKSAFYRKALFKGLRKN
jgi:hypothetical protein